MRQARLRDNSKKERGKRERGKLSLPVKATRILENWIPRKRPTVKLARTSTSRGVAGRGRIIARERIHYILPGLSYMLYHSLTIVHGLHG